MENSRSVKTPGPLPLWHAFPSCAQRSLRPPKVFKIAGAPTTSASDLASWPFLIEIIQLRECTCLPLLSASVTHTHSLSHATNQSPLIGGDCRLGGMERVCVRLTQWECGDFSSPMNYYVKLPK